MKKTKRRLPSEINAGSMADIAFLLLIFFLVVTTITEDKGILVRLPPWSDIPPTKGVVSNRNLLAININASGLLLIEKEESNISDLRRIAKEFITNPQQRPDLPANPKKAVISLRNDRGTPYQSYLSVYNEIKGAYNEVWTEKAQLKFKKSYDELPVSQQREIRSSWPQIISEAEPTRFY